MEGHKLIVNEVLARWVVWAAVEYGDRRERRNYDRVLIALDRTFGHTPAEDFDADRLEEFQAALAAGSWRRGTGA